MQIRGRSGGVMGRYSRGLWSLKVQARGDVGRWKVGQGDGEVLERSVELGSAERLPEVNDEKGRA